MAGKRPLALRLDHVTKVYGQGGRALPALQDITVDVEEGSFVCLVGASGCGKSTLLSIIDGLDPPTSGTVQVPGGRVAMMFQDASLFPWLTVAENVVFPLRQRGVPKDERQRRVSDLLRMVHLDGFADRRPHELSGGMRQRVSLARALAQEARVLLMDEPFGALDAMIRDLLHDELERLWSENGLTVVFVTHNVREAVRLGDRVLVLSSRPGRVAAEFAIDLPRPRQIDSAQNATLAAVITERLRSEIIPPAHPLDGAVVSHRQ
jgi:NitT/TauT family transport system ATP-binding protein